MTPGAPSPWQCYQQGKTATEAKAYGYTAANLRPNYTLDQLKTAYGASDLRNAGFTASDLKTAGGFTLSDLRTGGYQAANVKSLYTIGELKSVGYTAGQMKAAQFTLTELKDAGYTPNDLKTGGFTAVELKNSGYSAGDLRSVFFANTLRTAGFTAQEFKTANYEAAYVKWAGFNATELVGGSTAAPIYSLQELKDAGFTVTELNNNDALFLGGQLKTVFTLAEMQTRLPTWGVAKFKSLAYTAGEMKGVGYTVSDLKIPGGYTGGEMRTAGYTALQFKEAGINLRNSVGAGFSDTELKDGTGYSQQQVNNARTYCASNTCNP